MIKDFKKILITEFQLIPAGICLSLIFNQAAYLVLAATGVLLILFTLYFFRNPGRNIPAGENEIVSPADGKIVRILPVDAVPFLNASALRIDIFLSLTNVHINRIPVTGTVEYLAYQPGKFYPAMLSGSSELNEKMQIGIRKDKTKLLFCQVAGTIARRIVCDLRQGQNVQKGEVFGMIRFGSCVQVFMPLHAKLEITQGDKVRAGETILGRLYES